MLTRSYRTILIVDNEEIFRPLIELFLQECCHTVYASDCGPEAFTLFLQHKNELDVALVNVDWPNAHTLALIHTMRLLKPEIKLVCIADSVDEITKKNLAQEGVHHILLRPYSPRDVLQVIENACAQTTLPPSQH